MKFGLNITLLLAVELLAISCTSEISVKHANNLSSVVSVSESVECLWLPIEESAPEAQVTAVGANDRITPLSVRLSQTKVDYYMPISMQGVERLRVENCSYENICWQQLTTTPQAPDSSYRQYVHFSPERGWTNDPNGMFYKNGEWHLCYQHNPYGSKWGNLSWGHAVSSDLVHWEHLPDILYPDELGAIFSGSAVVDEHNTAGFGEGAVVAIYTSAGARQTQSIAYSLDGGMTFTKYEHNPVLTSHRADFRDPKVFWYAPRERWIMVLAAGNAMEIYSSANLTDWTFESRCGEDYGYHTGVWECPDLFELPYEDGTKWVLLCSLSIPERGGSSVQYFVGEFDGHRFTPDKKQPEADLLNYGRDYYATVSWSGVEDGRKVVVGWQNNWDYANDLPTKGYRGYMSLPHQLKLVNYSGEPKLVTEPAQEVMAHSHTLLSEEAVEVKDKYNAWRHDSKEGAFAVECDIENLSAQVVGLKLFNDSGEWVDVCFDFVEGVIRVDRTNSGEVDFNPRFPSISEAPLSESTEQHITMVVDRTSVECFTDIAAISNLVFPQGRYSRLSFHTIGGSATIRNLTIKEL
ncbi:MAG: GH32 C-terminal domain-containing protein [Tidjanibacter sp.]|nr:GH32 C-terminal domain-containing protein [Tidjanibacter sp.]